MLSTTCAIPSGVLTSTPSDWAVPTACSSSTSSTKEASSLTTASRARSARQPSKRSTMARGTWLGCATAVPTASQESSAISAAPSGRIDSFMAATQSTIR